MKNKSVREHEQADLAAREAAAIGGASPTAHESDQARDEPMRPVAEAGGGESGGFEEAEEMLIEHAGHGDQRPAHTVLHDTAPGEEDLPGRADGEADREELPSEQ